MAAISFDTLDAVPEDLREFAKEDGGKVVVNVVPSAKLVEFRDNNTKFMKERDEALSAVQTYKSVVGDDVSAFTQKISRLEEVAHRVKNGELVENTGLDEAVAARTSSMRAEYEKQIADRAKEAEAWKGNAKSLEGKYQKKLIDSAIVEAASNAKSGVRPEAIPDLLSRAWTQFVVKENGAIVPMNGDAIVYGADGVTPMSPLEWINKLKDSAPHYFHGSAGGGAVGGGIGGLTAKDFEGLSPVQKMQLARSGKL